MKKLLLVLILSAIGCARNKGVDVYTPPVERKTDQVIAGTLQFDINPEVDILFVVDDSESMGQRPDKNRPSNLEKLQQGSDIFVDGFGENDLFDYRVGVITVYDSRRCGSPDRKTGQIIQCPAEGALRAPFVSRGEGSKDKIREALDVGIKTLEQGGPQFEELFSPILSAASANVNENLNGGFFRKNSRKVVIMVTDEDDSSSSISVESFRDELDYAWGVGNWDLYGVLSFNGCPRASYADAPDRIMSAVKQPNRIYKICDENFGANLAQIGNNIREQMRPQVISLDGIPEAGTLVLKYGAQEIPMGAGWIFDPRTSTITVLNTIKVKYEPNARFSVTRTLIEPKSIVRGRAKPVDQVPSPKSGPKSL